jgi:ferredoxin
MKQIIVNNKCTGCGLCVVNCEYLRENDEGNAEAIEGKAIKIEDLDRVKRIVEDCPEKALGIIETGSTRKTGTAGIQEVIASLKKKRNEFTVKRVSNADLRLNTKDYEIPVPYSEKEYRYNYTSESAARSAASDEFRRLCYAETAYRPMLKKVFVEYKVKVLRPYYTCSDSPENIYFNYNQQVRKMLADVYAEIKDLLGDKNKIPESWKSFSVYLPKNDFNIEYLSTFDDLSTACGIITEVKDIQSFDSYIYNFDFEYTEEYAGEGLFGNPKYKKKYYFKGFYDAAKEFIDNIIWAVGLKSDEIEDIAVNEVNYVLEAFEKMIKEELERKIQELEKYVK